MTNKMKQYIYIILSFFILVSCRQDEILSLKSEGYLVLSTIEIQEIQVNKLSTRVAEATEPLHVDILRNGAVVSGHTYMTDNLPEKIKLPKGAYRLEVYSDSYKYPAGDQELGKAVFYYSADFQITDGETTRLGTVQVPMKNSGVTLSLPSHFEDWFTYTFRATIGGKTKVLRHGESAYFEIKEGDTLSYSLEATNTDGESQKKEGSHTPLSSGTIYQITYSFTTRSIHVETFTPVCDEENS